MAATDVERRGEPDNSINAETEIDLLELFHQMVEHLKYIVLSALICAAAAGAYTTLMVQPVYEATAKLYVLNSGGSAINLADLQIGSYLASDYQEVFKTWEVHEMVMENLHLDYSYGKMQRMLTVTNPSDSRILYITIRSHNPEEAATVANEYATVARKYISSTMATEEPNVLSVALVPTAPVSPSVVKNTLVGLLLGLFAAAGVVTAKFVLDDKIKSADDLQRYLDIPTLATVPLLDEGRRKAGRGSGR